MDDVSYTYQETPVGDVLVRSTDGAFIPLALGNMDYQAFLKWLDEGNPPPEGFSGPKN